MTVIEEIVRAEPEKLHYPWGVLQMRHEMRAYSKDEIDRTMAEVNAYEEMMRKHDSRRRYELRGVARVLQRAAEARSVLFDAFLRLVPDSLFIFWRRHKRIVRMLGLFLLFDLGFACGVAYVLHHMPPAPVLCERVGVYPVTEAP